MDGESKGALNSLFCALRGRLPNYEYRELSAAERIFSAQILPFVSLRLWLDPPGARDATTIEQRLGSDEPTLRMMICTVGADEEENIWYRGQGVGVKFPAAVFPECICGYLDL